MLQYKDMLQYKGTGAPSQVSAFGQSDRLYIIIHMFWFTPAINIATHISQHRAMYNIWHTHTSDLSAGTQEKTFHNSRCPGGFSLSKIWGKKFQTVPHKNVRL
jgi:hypothetical protein